jgi:hypothetical protein
LSFITPAELHIELMLKKTAKLMQKMRPAKPGLILKHLACSAWPTILAWRWSALGGALACTRRASPLSNASDADRRAYLLSQLGTKPPLALGSIAR